MSNEERALLLAQRIHQNEQYDIYPYIYHIIEIRDIAKKLGYDEEIVVACILHDTLEDGAISYNDIKKAFGERVADIVYDVTDELGKNRKERKEKTYPKTKANWKAIVVKLCDRIANVRHSGIYAPDKYKMYQREHFDFCEALGGESLLITHIEINRAYIVLEREMSKSK